MNEPTPEMLAESQSRYGWHKGTEVTGPMHQAVRTFYAEMDAFLQAQLPDGRAKSLARTALEESAMWANKAVAELAPVVTESLMQRFEQTLSEVKKYNDDRSLGEKTPKMSGIVNEQRDITIREVPKHFQMKTAIPEFNLSPLTEERDTSEDCRDLTEDARRVRDELNSDIDKATQQVRRELGGEGWDKEES